VPGTKSRLKPSPSKSNSVATLAPLKPRIDETRISMIVKSVYDWLESDFSLKADAQSGTIELTEKSKNAISKCFTERFDDHTFHDFIENQVLIAFNAITLLNFAEPTHKYAIHYDLFNELDSLWRRVEEQKAQITRSKMDGQEATIDKTIQQSLEVLKACFEQHTAWLADKYGDNSIQAKTMKQFSDQLNNEELDLRERIQFLLKAVEKPESQALFESPKQRNVLVRFLQALWSLFRGRGFNAPVKIFDQALPVTKVKECLDGLEEAFAAQNLMALF